MEDTPRPAIESSYTEAPRPVRPTAPDPAVVALELERDRARPRFDQLLRRPEVLLERLEGPGASATLWFLFVVMLIGHVLYGLVVGSFSGGEQWWASPAKVVLGTLLCGVVCFPSLYIFLSLSGAELRLRHAVGLLLGALASTGIFLAGFGPVAWVFSQSSTTVSLLAPIHLLLWCASLIASKRVFNAGLKHWGARKSGWIGLWLTILLITCLQMMTTLRPLLGTAERFYDPTRKFFLVHWAETMNADARRP